MLLVVVRSKRASRASVLEKRKKEKKKNEPMLAERCFTSTETVGLSGTWNESKNDVCKQNTHTQAQHDRGFPDTRFYTVRQC